MHRDCWGLLQCLRMNYVSERVRNLSNLHPFEVVCRVSEQQFLVGGILNFVRSEYKKYYECLEYVLLI